MFTCNEEHRSEDNSQRNAGDDGCHDAETDQSSWITLCMTTFDLKNAEAKAMQKRAPSHPEQDAEKEGRERPSESPRHECDGEGDQQLGTDDNVLQAYASAAQSSNAGLTNPCVGFLHRRRRE